MKISTFIDIYYNHRLQKANFLKKIYIYLIIPFNYFIEKINYPRIVNLDEYAKDNKEFFKKNLNFLFEYFNSDKGEKYINQYTHPSKRDNLLIKAHGYSKYYERIFLKFKNDKINILEIGSFYGNASAALFFYFKNANIFGADINPDMFNYKSQRLTSFYVNSSSELSLQKDLLEKKIQFKIIIEDASHMLKDQIISLFYLFSILQSGGYFIIEELDFPEKRADMRINQDFPDLKTILRDIKQKKNFESKYVDKSLKKYFLENFDSIEFFKGNTNEIAIIKKK